MKRNHGFTIVEILVSLAVFTIVSFGTISFYTHVLNVVKTESLKALRNVENTEMAKLLSQPIYFGALANYPANSQLKECMTLDEKICEASVEYSLTPYDLSKNDVLKTASLSEEKDLVNDLKFKIHCLNEQASCDKADYFSVLIKTSLDYYGIKLFSIEKNVIVRPEISNVTTYIPDAILSEGSPINIILFMDPSNSMQNVKERIKEGVDGLVARLANYNVTLGIYSLNSSQGTTEKSSIYTLDSNNIATYYNVITDATSQLLSNIYQYHEYGFYTYTPYNGQAASAFQNLTSASTTRVFKLNATDTSAVRAQKVQSIQYVLESMYANAVDNEDQTLCSMMRLLDTPSVLQTFQFDQKIPTILYLITNEDDESSKTGTLNNCQKSLLTKSDPAPEWYQYYVKYHAYEVTFTATHLKDGALGQTTKKDIRTVVPYSASFVDGGDCLTAINNWSAADITTLIKYYIPSYTAGSPYTISSCKEKLGDWLLGPNAYYTTKQTALCAKWALGVVPASKDTAVKNSAVPGSCYEKVLEQGNNYVVTTVKQTFFQGDDEPVDATYKLLQSTIGLDKFYYVPIIHTTDVSSCPLTEGAKIGTKYIDLAKKSGIKSEIISICSTSYLGPLSEIENWTTSLASNNITLPVTVASALNAVEI
ncbi:MAG: prepilin-type N-terminal cleavage/methylation domain-containing protein, partial [Bdellovibrio sp.]